jgi:hypothetical protein
VQRGVGLDPLVPSFGRARFQQKATSGRARDQFMSPEASTRLRLLDTDQSVE